MKLFSSIVAGVGTFALAVVLFAAGFFACAAPLTTQLLSQGTSDYERSPYALDDLNTLAVASRDLTVDARPAGTTADDARRTFNEALMLAATHSSGKYLASDAAGSEGSDDSDGRKRQLWEGLLSDLGAPSPADAFTLQDVNATAQEMALFSDAFALDADAFSHLDDCNSLIRGGILFVEVCAAVFAVCLVILLALRKRAVAGRMLTIAPIVLVVAFVALGVWAVLDFRGFFSAFHGVFFPQGNWTFSIDSLLICMYPTAFWMGMGIIWLAVTLLASIVTLFIGRKAGHRAR